MSRSRSVAGALMALAISLSACSGGEAAAPTPLRPAVVTPVLVQDLEERIEVSGELLAKHDAEVAAQVAGEITEVLFDEGDAVEAGAVVIEIDPEKRNLDLAAARARVGEAEASVAERVREVKRMRVLAAKKISSETQLDSAETGPVTG